MKDLNGFIKDNQKFLSIQDGDSVTLVYKGYSIVADRFNPGKETVSYLFAYPDSDKNIPWNKSSNKVAMQMAKVEIGDTVTISRNGEGMGTVYRIKVKGKPLSNASDDQPPF